MRCVGFAGTVKLPHVPRQRMKICMLGDAAHCEKAQNIGMPYRSVEDLKKLNKNKKLVKKLAAQYDAFLASQVTADAQCNQIKSLRSMKQCTVLLHMLFTSSCVPLENVLLFGRATSFRRWCRRSRVCWARV